MTAKEALEQIKGLFAEQAAEEKMPEEQKPEAMEAKEYVLEDGTTKVLISELEIGGMVSIMNEDGTTAPAPAGDHKLVDGTTITVGENGLITAVSVPEPAAAPEPIAEATRAELAAFKAEHAEQFATWATERDALNAALKGYEDKLRVMAGIVESMLQTPSAEPVEPAKDKFEFHQPSHADRMSALLATIDNMKK